MEENKNIKKNQIIKGVALLGVFLMVFGASYALFSVVLTGTKKNKIQTANMSLRITDKNGNPETEGTVINLEGAVPMSAKDGIETVEAYEFNIENNGNIPVDYELYLDPTAETDLDGMNIKYNLERIDTGELLSLDIMDLTDENADYDSEEWAMARLLGRMETTKDGEKMYKLDLGTIPSGTSYKYALKIWVSYASNTEAMNKTFEANLKLYGTQTTKDSVYVVEEYRVDESDLTNQLYLRVYSDDSIRIEGEGGDLSDVDDILKSYLIYSDITDEELETINTELQTLGYAPLERNIDLWSNFQALCAAGDVSSRIELADKIAPIFNNITYSPRTLYIGDGIMDIKSGHFNFDSVKSFTTVYISTTVSSIGRGSFSKFTNLEKVIFFNAEDNYYNAQYELEGLSLDKNAFSGLTTITEIRILDNLVDLGTTGNSASKGDPFLGLTNAHVYIEALQSNVTVHANAFTDAAVTWVNG